MVRVETNAQAQAIRLSIKTTNAAATLALKKIFLSHLAKEPQPNQPNQPATR